MLKEMILSQWKSFNEATLYLDPVTVLVGSNASGKSNVLDALLFLHRLSLGNELTQAIMGDAALPTLRGGLEWVCLKPHTQFTLKLRVGHASEPSHKYVYTLRVDVTPTKAQVAEESLQFLPARGKEKRLFYTGLPSSSDAVALPVFTWTSKQGRTHRHDMGRHTCILNQLNPSSVNKEVAEGLQQMRTALQGIVVLDPIPNHMRGYSQLSRNLKADGSNIAGVLATLPNSEREYIEQTLTHYLKALPERDIQRVWAETVGKFNADAMLYCSEGWHDNTTHDVDARGMSDGTLRYAAIIVALLTQRKNSLLVIEEIDNGLHPSRAKQLLDMLKTLGERRGIDVLVTTHNPTLLDAAGSAMVPFITAAYRDADTGFSQLKTLDDVARLPKLLAGGSLGDLATSGALIDVVKQRGAN